MSGGGGDPGHHHAAEGGDFRAKVWSMTGGPYCRPKHWKRNTAIAMFGVFLICIPIAMKSAELEVCLGLSTSDTFALALFDATLPDCMEYLHHHGSSDNNDDIATKRGQLLIRALLDDNLSPDEIDRRYGKDACRNALNLVNNL